MFEIIYGHNISYVSLFMEWWFLLWGWVVFTNIIIKIESNKLIIMLSFIIIFYIEDLVILIICIFVILD